MYVLKSNTLETAKGNITLVDKSNLIVWANVFCEAFSVPGWKTEVLRIVSTNLRNIKLLLIYGKENTPAGCAALYFKNGFTGIYCLGTIPNLRRRGLAGSILKNAAYMSENLFLQTLGSEGLLTFYEKAGFKVAYTKKIYIVARPRLSSN